jgi:ATP-dependent Lon protease
VSGYTREAGVRQLERELGKVMRKVAREIAAGDTIQLEVDQEAVERLLGRPRVHPEQAARQAEVGIATGMYYTPVGGDIMFVEASIMRGKGELVLTGQLGDVMKESARAGLTYAKTHADDLGIPVERFTDKDVHIHVPAGAIPKEGSSAGITMATALVSALSGVPVRNDVAMTGEVTLSGRVLPIGGVKEKVLGALRAGITTIILPKENLPDLDDIREDERAKLDVHPVGHLSEVLAVALQQSKEVPEERARAKNGDLALTSP